jgi:uncharacterized OB-fold protein
VTAYLPDRSWAPTRPFWEGAAQGELRFPCCDSCGRFQWYPRPMCPVCFSTVFCWRGVEPRGTVYSFSVVRREFLPAPGGFSPFAVIQADIDAAPGVKLIANLKQEVNRVNLTIGAPVEVVFADLAAGPLPLFRLAEGLS